MNSHTQYAKDWYIELSIFICLFPYLLTLLITYLLPLHKKHK